MQSGTERIALQLTRWVGGTIMVLMFLFVLVDLGIQTRQFRKYHYGIAREGVEDLCDILRWQTMEEGIGRLRDGRGILGYFESRRLGFAIFDWEGNELFATPSIVMGAGKSKQSLFLRPEGGETVTYTRELGGFSFVAAARRFRPREKERIDLVAVYVFDVTEHRHAAILLWGWRAVLILVVIVGVMFAVRIPVKRFVTKPMNGLFMASYAASKDDFSELPPCPVNNEFVGLYEMFNRLMGHLSDTRLYEATLLEEADGEREEAGAEDE